LLLKRQVYKFEPDIIFLYDETILSHSASVCHILAGKPVQAIR
jgi:hypothetical protein